jgi:23S rRNA (guanine745-N1)-methyltransferase
MKMNDAYSMVCASSHNFDLAKKGYISLLTSGSKASYAKELFEARQKICEAGFYDPLIEELAKIIDKYQPEGQKEINLLDAGCGEGSHLYRLSQRLKSDLRYNLIGIDITKEGINLAAGRNGNIIWCVADLARLPFQDKSFHFILNILSPANYGEFERILRNRGFVVKVVPEPGYLLELREAIYKNEKQAHYSNEQVINYFRQKMQLVEMKKIRYEFPLDEELFPHLLKMTPLTWGGSSEGLNRVWEEIIPSVTVDLKIIIGKRK